MEFTSRPLQLLGREVLVHEVSDQRGFFFLQSIFDDPSIRERIPHGTEPQICIEGDRGKVYVDPDGSVFIPVDETQLNVLGVIDTATVQIAKGSELILPLQTETGTKDLSLGSVITIQVSQRN